VHARHGHAVWCRLQLSVLRAAPQVRAHLRTTEAGRGPEGLVNRIRAPTSCVLWSLRIGHCGARFRTPCRHATRVRLCKPLLYSRIFHRRRTMWTIRVSFQH
jgi:hypothetical protein